MEVGDHPVVVVTGGRDYADREAVFAALNEVHRRAKNGIYRVIHGACPTGADAHASAWCKDQPNVLEARFHARWDEHGRRAGPIRNKAMCEFAERHITDDGDCVVLAFPGGRGTASCVLEARRLGLQVVEMGG